MNAFGFFIAVFLATCFAHELDRYRIARERNRVYCRKQALYYTWCYRRAVAAKSGSADLDAKQGKWWEGEVKSWVPIHPTEDEEALEIEESLENRIKQVIGDYNFFQKRAADEEEKQGVSA